MLRPRPERQGLFILSPHFWASAAITAFFIAMMFLLWRREAGGRTAMRKLGVSPEELSVTWADYAQFMRIERDGERVGGYILRVRRVPELEMPGKIGYDLESRSRLNLKVAGQEVSATTDAFVHMNDLFELVTFQGGMTTMGQHVTVDAFTEGLNLYYKFKLPPFLLEGADRERGAITSKTALTEPVILTDAIRPLVTNAEKLRVGAKWTTLGSDPISGRFNVVVNVEVEALEEIEMEGEKIQAYRVKESAGEIATTSWYNLAGEVLKSDLGNRLTMTRVPELEVQKFLEEFGLPPSFREIDKADLRTHAVEQKESLVDRLMKAAPAGNF